MSLSPFEQPTLDFYTRAECDSCHDARVALQSVLEERVRRGDPIPRVRFRDVAASAELESDFGSRVPVIALGGDELSLTITPRAIARFLDRVLGRAA